MSDGRDICVAVAEPVHRAPVDASPFARGAMRRAISWMPVLSRGAARIAPSVALIFLAGAGARLAGLLAAIVLNRWGSDAGVSEFYLSLTYAQSMAFYCHLGVATTVLAALIARGKGETPPERLPLQLLLAAQSRALPIVLTIGAALFVLSGLDTGRLATLATAVVTAYGMAYNQIKIACLLGSHADRRNAAYTFAVSCLAYGPVVVVAWAGRSEYCSAALAAGFALPVVYDALRAGAARERTGAADLTALKRGGGYVALGNSVYAFATLLVIHRLDSTLAQAAVIAFGIVQQVRSYLLFASVQVGPLIVRTVARRSTTARQPDLRAIALCLVGANGAMTAVLVLPLVLAPAILSSVFSDRVSLDAAVQVGLWSAIVVAMTTASCRVLEGRGCYREIFHSNIVYAGVLVAVGYAAPGTHLGVQTAFLAAAAAQLLWLLKDIVRARGADIGARGAIEPDPREPGRSAQAAG